MPDDDKLLKLLVRWDELAEQGKQATAEELCRACPDLLPAFRQRLAEAREFDQRLRPPPTDPLRTHIAGTGNGRAGADSDVALLLNYVDLRMHARGGLGEVLLATDAAFGRTVALKCIQHRYASDRRAVDGFQVEAEVTGRLEHPGIVPVHGRGKTPDGRPCYAMRFIEGETLKDAIDAFHAADVPGRSRTERSLALRALLGRFIDVCNTLAYVHNRGILHRDIKPQNVMLGKYGETLLVDWGLAKSFAKAGVTDSSGERSLRPHSVAQKEETLLGDAKGTPAYMSPEQAAGDPEHARPASDIFSLGALLYCILTGRPPYQAKELPDVVAQAQAANFLPPHEVKRNTPRALEAVCLKAMARSPQARYAAASDLAKDVESWLADEAVSAWREPFRVRVARWMRRRQAVVIGIGAVLALLVVSLTGAVLLTEAWRRHQGAQDDVEYLLFIIDNFHAPVDLPDAEVTTPLDASTKERLVRGARRLLEARPSPAESAGWQVTYRRLGDLCSRHDLHGEAAGFYRRVLELRRDSHPPDHPELLAAIQSLADCQERQGLLIEAEELCREHLDGCRRAFEADHKQIRTALFNLAKLLERMQRPTEAERRYRECLDAERRKLGPAEPETLTTLNRLGDLLEAYRQHEKAAALYEEWLTHLKGLDSSDSRRIAVESRLRNVQR